MPISEDIITGKKYRVWSALANKWKRYSFWSKASDVEMNDGTTVEANITTVQGAITELTSDIADGLPVESDASSSENAYTTGEHFMLNGQYCVATDDITIGDALVENTNYEEDSMGNAIEQINSALNKGSVSVTADGVKTYSTLLDSLYALINRTKITNDSKLVVVINDEIYISNICSSTDSRIRFSRTDITGGTNGSINIYQLQTSGSSLKGGSAASSVTDRSTDVPANGSTITVYY